MSAPRFVRLTEQDGAPVWMRADFIHALYAHHTGGTALGGFLVRETPEEILALLAAPAPSVEVTESVLDAAWAAYDDAASTGRDSMRAAIEAADRARGLRE